MNPDNCALATGLVPEAYIAQGRQELNRREGLVRSLLAQRRLPDSGWDDASIQHLLSHLALMDSNNFSANVGLGEREARVFSGLVRQRHFHLGHGIGRSGDVAAVQPKAAGSSVLYQLTNALARDAVRLAGLRAVQACLVLPLATGMSVALTLMTLRAARPRARFVVWPRIDQKSCFKAVLTAGLEPVVVELERDGDVLRCSAAAVARAVEEAGADNVLCVLSTTSCFAPRVPDPVDELAALCQAQGVPHVVNNAYGLQSSKICHLVETGMRRGRVDAVVQSTDKNFMVPVGGAIVASADKAFVAAVGKSYAGRASAAPIVDLFITLLAMGRDGYARLLAERKALAAVMAERLRGLGRGTRLLETRDNQISFALAVPGASTMLGSQLFSRGVSGTRVVPSPAAAAKAIGPFTFANYGAHSDDYPHTYVTAACSIGLTGEEVEVFMGRLESLLGGGDAGGSAGAGGSGGEAGAGGDAGGDAGGAAGEAGAGQD